MVMPTFKILICITQLSSRKVLSTLLVYIALRVCKVKTDVFTSLKNLCQFPQEKLNLKLVYLGLLMMGCSSLGLFLSSDLTLWNWQAAVGSRCGEAPGTGCSVGTQGKAETGAVSSGACENPGITPVEMVWSLCHPL